MRIGFDAKRYFHNNTGLGNYSRTLVNNLKQMYPHEDYLLYDEKSWARTFRLGHMAANDGCQIYHGLSNELPHDYRACQSRGVRCLVTIHDVAWRTFPDMYHFFDRHIYDIKYGRSCKVADKVIAISESTKRDIMRYYDVPEDHIEVIYQPVQDYYYSPLTDTEIDQLIHDHFASSQQQNISNISSPIGEVGRGLSFILYVGSINSRKNLLSALQALSLIPAENRPLLLIIGNGREYRRECEQFIHANNLEQYTRIETNIHNNSLLQALYARAKAFIYPSFYEGFGLPVVEAALQQTPVITTTVSSLPEAAGPDALLIDPHSPDAAEQMAHHIDHLLSSPDYAHEIGIKMEQYARRMFTPQHLTRQVMDLYERIK